jgi:hypothetical protein
MFGKRHAPGVPARTPHPDPRTETRLQRIIALRESADRKGALIGQYTAEVGKLSTDYRSRVNYHFGNGTGHIKARIKDLQREIRQLEGEIDRTHEDIAKRTDELDDTDLSYL